MLGHEVAFAYCRAAGTNLPCRRIFDCWWEVVDIEGFVREHFDQSEINSLFAPRKDKMITLVELIEKARRNNKTSG